MNTPVTLSPGDAGTTATDTPAAVSWLLCTHVFDAQLQEALASCLNQSFKDFELVCVVNGANVRDVAQQVRATVGHDPRVRVIETPIAHLTFSLSLGLHHAQGDLIARMDGDDIAYPHRLAQQVDHMRAHPETTVLGSAYDIIDAVGNTLSTVVLPLEDAAIRRRLFSGNPLCHPSVMFRRDAIAQVGGYLGSPYAQDYDLWARVALQTGVRFANLAEPCIGYRATPVGQARRSRWAYAAMAAAQYRNFVGTGQWRWGTAAALSLAKACWRAR